jgi:hypothetical protein
MVVTFTPLEGFTEVVSSFLDSDDPDKYFTKIKWVDCPHLSPEEIARMSRKYPKHQLKARSEGEPGAGDGVIYERDIDEFTVPWFAIPDGWPRAFGMDVGKTAVVWGAMNPDTDTLYLYDEYYSEEYNPVLHFDAIKRRGLWIPGVIDPGSLGSSQVDGQRLFDIYRKMGLDLDTADNAVEAGISEVWMRIQSDRLKIFPTLNKFRDEYARYHRQKQETVFGIKSSAVKKHDHLLDACVSADTLVQTEFGPVMIKDLVGKSGRVISRSGSVATFTDCQMTQANAPTVCLTFNDGSEVVCTPDHKFLTMDGWVDAAALPGHTCYNGLAQWEQLQHWKSSLFQQPFRNFKAAVTTFAESISSLREYDFTGLFGWQPTGLVPFPISTTYTTTTTTDPTTSPATSSSYQSSSIAASTQRLVALPTTLRNSAQQQQSGTDQMRAVTGIKGITRRLSTSCMSMLNYIATSAGSCSWPRRAGSAPTTASQSGAGVLVLTTKNALAWFAAQSLWLTGTSGRMAVRDRAVINCVNVSASKPQNVYCLTVPGSHSFCIGSGLVVHNCRYLHTSGIARMKRQYRPAPPQASIFDNGSFSSGGSGWQVM